MRILQTEHTRIETENQLRKSKAGFSESYLAVQYLFSHIRKHPRAITEQTADSLLFLLCSKKFDKKKQAYFLYKEAADALIHISKDITHALAGYAVLELQDILLESTGNKQRAVSESLGSLPVKIKGPDAVSQNEKDILSLTFEQLIHHLGTKDTSTMQWHGRTLRFKAENKKIWCIKFANSKENIEQISMEAFWLNYLKNDPVCNVSEFKIPEPLSLEGRFTFKLSSLPDLILNKADIYDEYTAIAFMADPDYFVYPNDPDQSHHASIPIKDIFKKNARLLGKLTSKGLIHTALIPLFHNRVQQSRRQDGGLYIWELGGRLDRWLESSLYPNFAVSGLRDFEHIISIETTRDIRHFIGEHILGFILVLGSFFRNKAPEMIGFDEDGQPVDTRHLFEPNLFSQILEDVVKTYYRNVTGFPLKKPERIFKHHLVDDLIQSMGVDHYMEETLRVQDQENMNEKRFKEFLISRGYDQSRIDKITKGKEDIVLTTGPHLGGFNQPICVPELVDFLFCMSSLCISDRYIMENRLKA